MSAGDEPQRRRKTRTRSHIIEDISENYLERNVLLKGHVLRRPKRDYGIDVSMFHFDETGQIENGEVRFQLKATEKLELVDCGEAITVRVDTRDLDHWLAEVFPLILIAFDAVNERAFWLDVKEYADEHPQVVKAASKSVRLRIPYKNELTPESVELFRLKSLQIVDQLKNQTGSPDASRNKPR